MTSPMNRLMDAVEWHPVIGATPEGDIPYATHEGILKIGDAVFRVYQLSNGKRVVDRQDIEDFFEGLKR